MKRKSTVDRFNKLKYRFPPVTLYLDDITKIIEALDKQGAKYSISDIEYSYDSLEDVRLNCGEFINDLSITAQFDNFNYLTLNFERGGILLKSDNYDKNVIIFHDIKQIIERQSPWYLRVINSWIFLFTVFLILAIAWQIKPSLIAAFPNQSYWLEMIIIFCGYFVFTSYVSNQLKPKIYFKNKQQVKNFFRENADKLIIALIASILGAFIKTLFDKIF